MDKTYEKFYQGTTNTLLKKLGTMGLSADERARATDIVSRFRNAFKSQDIKNKTFPDEIPDSPEIAARIYPSNGFCRASSLAFCALMGGKENGWRVKAIPEMFAPYGPHHYIFHEPSNTVLDLTADQFTHAVGLQEIPYKYGEFVSDEFGFNDTPYNFARAIGIDLSYEKTTNQLVAKAKTFKDIHTEHFSLPQIVYLLRSAFKDDEVYKRLAGRERLPYRNKSEGFCAPSSYIIYNMTGADKVWELRHVDVTHWWLVHKQTGEKFDITYTQFKTSLLNHYYQIGKPGLEYLANNPDKDVLIKQLSHTLAQSAGLE